MNQFLSEPLWLRTTIVISGAFVALFVAIVICYLVQHIIKGIRSLKKPSTQRAVRVETKDQYNIVIDMLTRKGFRSFEIGAKFSPCYITVQHRYIQASETAQLLDGYELISFDDFIATF